MIDREKVFDALRSCITEPKCKDCPWETCEEFHQTKTIPLDLCLDILKLLKEQDAFQWINVKDKLPEKDGQYLVVYTFFDCRSIGVARFSHNLHEIDEYIFDTESRPGWYEPDDEVGYFERTTVTHWAKLPEFPKEGR